MALDKKSKKRLEVLRKRLEKLQLQLTGAKQQEDEPGEAAKLEKEIAEVHAEMQEIKG
jgi:hypothetical protein